jgi:hypothetical protein
MSKHVSQVLRKYFLFATQKQLEGEKITTERWKEFKQKKSSFVEELNFFRKQKQAN